MMRIERGTTVRVGHGHDRRASGSAARAWQADGVAQDDAGARHASDEGDGETVDLHARRRRGRRPRGRDDLAGRRSATAPRFRTCATRPSPATAPDGNCRACMVEIEGERVLAAELHPHADARHEGARPRPTAPRPRASMVFELLVTDQPDRDVAHDPDFELLADGPTRMKVEREPLPARAHAPAPDRSHPAMAVNLDACIQCNLCVRACREVQVNDVIGMAGRGHREKIVFDFDDPMGDSTCVACGECVQACPTGALMPATLVDENNVFTQRARPHGRQRLPLLRRRLPAHLPHQGRQARSTSAAATARPTRTGSASRAASASTTCSNPQRLTQAADPQGRRRRRQPTIWSIRPIRGRISARRPGRRRSTAPPRAS